MVKTSTSHITRTFIIICITVIIIRIPPGSIISTSAIRRILNYKMFPVSVNLPHRRFKLQALKYQTIHKIVQLTFNKRRACFLIGRRTIKCFSFSSLGSINAGPSIKISWTELCPVF